MDSQKVTKAVTPVNPVSEPVPDPDPGSGAGAGAQTLSRRKPGTIPENIGFRLEFTPSLTRGRNDRNEPLVAFYDFIKFEGSKLLLEIFFTVN
jgi:hypothetical protein